MAKYSSALTLAVSSRGERTRASGLLDCEVRHHHLHRKVTNPPVTAVSIPTRKQTNESKTSTIVVHHHGFRVRMFVLG